MHLRLTFLLFDFWWLPNSDRPDCVAQAPMLPTPTPKITTDDHLESWRTPWKFNGWNLKSWRIMEVWKMIFLFNLVIFRWSILIFRCLFRLPIFSLAFVVQPFEPWDQGQSVVSPWLPCGSYVAGQTEGLCTRCFGERRGSCPKPERSLPDGFFLWKTDPTKKSNLKTSTSENKLGSLFSQWIGGFQALILGRVTYP